MEVALALALLVGAGVLGRTMLRLNAVDPGFRVDHLAVATVSLDGTPYTAPDARRAAFARVREGLASMIERTDADELIVATQIYDHAERVRSYEIVMEAAANGASPSRG